jgi:predicted molibdopterin-dependent oxidoreductase YjgC
LFEVIDGKIESTLPLKSHPVNQGKLCIKGWNLHEYINSYMRLKSPLIKENKKFETATWDEAITATAAGLDQVKQTYGPDAIGVLVSAKITNEENFLAQKFTRAAIGTNNVDHCARL